MVLAEARILRGRACACVGLAVGIQVAKTPAAAIVISREEAHICARVFAGSSAAIVVGLALASAVDGRFATHRPSVALVVARAFSAFQNFRAFAFVLALRRRWWVRTREAATTGRTWFGETAAITITTGRVAFAVALILYCIPGSLLS